MVEDRIFLNERYIGTKKLKGQICKVVGFDSLNIYVASLTYPQNPVAKIPKFYFKETFRSLDKGEEERVQTVLTKHQVEDIVIVVEKVLHEAYLNKMVSIEIASHLTNVIAYNLISILGDLK